MKAVGKCPECKSKVEIEMGIFEESPPSMFIISGFEVQHLWGYTICPTCQGYVDARARVEISCSVTINLGDMLGSEFSPDI